jgi:hypothetical protein
MKPPMIIAAAPVDRLAFGATTAGNAHSMEPLDHRVVPAIAIAAHRASHAESLKLLHTPQEPPRGHRLFPHHWVITLVGMAFLIGSLTGGGNGGQHLDPGVN